MYQSLYNLISDLIFDGNMTPFQDEIVQVLSTVTSLWVVILPLLALVHIIKTITTIWR